MVTVAKSFEAPIKRTSLQNEIVKERVGHNMGCVSITVVFPQDLLEKGLDASNFAMLGLGDIVIPGIFIALLLRFDNRLVVLQFK